MKVGKMLIKRGATEYILLKLGEKPIIMGTATTLPQNLIVKNFEERKNGTCVFLGFEDGTEKYICSVYFDLKNVSFEYFWIPDEYNNVADFEEFISKETNDEESQEEDKLGSVLNVK